MDLTVKKTTPIVEPMAQLNIGGLQPGQPPDGKVRGTSRARPLTERKNGR